MTWRVVSCCAAAALVLQMRLLTGVAFASGNLQSKLLYAGACFKYGSWHFDRLNGPSLQTFQLTFSAQFVPKAGQQPAVSVKPAPPLIKPLPPDLFYPFLTSGGPRSQPQRQWTVQHWLLFVVLLWVGQLVTGGL